MGVPVQKDSANASLWGTKIGQVSSLILSNFLRVCGFSIVGSHLGILRRPGRLFFVNNAFYRPILLWARFIFWGAEKIRLPENVWEESARKVINNEGSDSPTVVPIGFMLSRILPQTEYSLARECGNLGPEPEGSWVAVGEPSNDLVKVQLRTRSYFHFLLETIPLLLENLDSKRLLVFVEKSWQKELLSFFVPDASDVDGRVGHYKYTIQKSKWALYPREDHIIALREVFSERRSRGFAQTPGGIFVNRSRDIASTGRIPSDHLVTKICSRVGLEAFEPARFPIGLQFGKFSTADRIVAPHGSALASIVASLELKALVELHSFEQVAFHIEYVSKVLGVPYRALLLEESDSGEFRTISDRNLQRVREFLSEGC